MANSSSRFDPLKNSKLNESWQRSEKQRRRRIAHLQLLASIQNFFWPTSLKFVFVIYVSALATSVSYFGFQKLPSAVTVSVLLTQLLVGLRQFILFLLLRYNRWLLEVKPSILSQLWFKAVSLFSSSLPNWFSGNWLLPSYPSPPQLRQTVNMFLSSMEPCLSEEKYEDVSRKAESFLIQEGPILQRKLHRRALMSRNWLAPWWIEYGYLRCRMEVYRTFMSAIGPQVRLTDHWIDSAALIAYGSYQYLVHKLATRELPPSASHGVIPLEMKYLDYITGGCRVPKEEIDSYHWTPAWKDAFIVVHAKGRYFKLFMHDSSGQQISPGNLSDMMQEMFRESKLNPRQLDPSVFTYLPRENWAQTYKMLVSDDQNRRIFEEISRAAFVVHLVDGVETFQQTLDCLSDSQFQLWCDKSLNIVVNTAGYMYYCCEHSHCDAVLLASILSDFCLIARTKLTTPSGKLDETKFPRNTHYPDYCELVWKIPEETFRVYEEAKREIGQSPSLKSRVCLRKFYLDRSLIKACRMGPDSFIQSVLYWAYFRKHGKVVNSYQPATLMYFKGGRTENTRPLSREKVEFVTQMDSPDVPDEVKLEFLQKSANVHHHKTRLATVGQGCDRHLLGLKVIAQRDGIKSEFLDFAFSEGMDFPLCTSVSQMTLLPEVKYLTQDDSNADFCLTGSQFRPLEPNQYGIRYMTLCQRSLKVTITDLEGSSETNADEMGDMIARCFEDIYNLMSRVSSTPRKEHN